MNEYIQDQEPKQKVDVEVKPIHNKKFRIEMSYSLDFLTYLLESEPQTCEEYMNSSKGP